MNARESQRILLVDDNIANLRLLELTFAEAGIEVFVASSVAAAQKILQKFSGEIDLILSDVQMPGETGFDLVRWIKQQPFSPLPILLITSVLPEPEHRIFGLNLGAVDYVTRAEDPSELVIRVKNALANFNRLKTLRVTLEQSESLALFGKIFAASNHEIKNIIQIVDIFCKNLEQEISSLNLQASAPLQKNMDCLKSSVSTLLEMVKSLHSTFDNSPHEMTAIDVCSLAQSIIDMMAPTVQGSTIEVLKYEKPVFVLGRAIHFKQVLINLLLNAQHAISEARPEGGGTIRISFEEDSAGNFLTKVSDNGVGFPRAEVRKDFQPFMTTRQLRGGKGLGLWLCSRLIERMGGTLELKSEGPGQGAVATVGLKRALASKVLPAIDLADYLKDAAFH